MRQIWTLSDEDARIAIDTVRRELARRGKSATVAVVDVHGETLGLARMDGAALSTVAVAANKAYTAARLRRPTAEVGRKVRHPETGFDISYYGDSRYVGFGGGLPVLRGGDVVGGVGVSGLVSEEDEELAALAIVAILESSTTAGERS